LIPHDTINTQNTNLIRRPKKPITIAALVCAFSSCELKSTTSLSDAASRVYASTKAPVKRNCVISIGCAAQWARPKRPRGS
jgi:hypothetical protein